MLPSSTRPAGLTLRVRDADQVERFYTGTLGLEVLERRGAGPVLGPPDGGFELSLEADPSAPLRPGGTTGLYHFALLLPDRPGLAAVVRRLQAEGVPFVGFADHGVSEAAYLEDPEGNGIELYRDRPAEAWPRSGGEIAMVTKPLPLDDLLSEASRPAGVPAGTRLGHVHLHVPDLERAGRFFQDVGFSTTQTTYPGALFLAAGDYHHHVGLNRWADEGRPPDGSTGLLRVDWSLPEGTLDELRDDWVQANLAPEEDASGFLVRDPVGVEHRFRVREAPSARQ